MISLNLQPPQPLHPLDIEYHNPRAKSASNQQQTRLSETTETIEITSDTLLNSQISNAIAELTHPSRFSPLKMTQVVPYHATFVNQVQKTQQPWWMFDALLYHILNPTLVIHETLQELNPSNTQE